MKREPRSDSAGTEYEYYEQERSSGRRGKRARQKAFSQSGSSERDRVRSYREERSYYKKSLKEHSYQSGGRPGDERYADRGEDSRYTGNPYGDRYDDLYRDPYRDSYREDSYRDPYAEERYENVRDRNDHRSRESHYAMRSDYDRFREEPDDRRYADPYAYRDSDYAGGPASAAGKKKKKSRGGKVLKGILCFLAVLVAAAVVIWFVPGLRGPAVKAILQSPLGPPISRLILGKSYEEHVQDTEFDESQVIIHEGVSVPKGNTTIALFGLDTRTEDVSSATRADSIMVVNVDDDGNIKMASIFRDTYLLSRNSEGTAVISKANSAYYRGGPLGTVNMLNENFDLGITDYVTFNFWGMTNIVDLMGGLTLKITEEERELLNGYAIDQSVNAGTEFVPLEESGDAVVLNGNQVTAFCRLRYVDFESPLDGVVYQNDYGRAARQRYVLTELLSQAKGQGMLKLLQIAKQLFQTNTGETKTIQTSMDINEMLQLFLKGYDMNLAGSAGFPALDHQYTAMLDSGDTVVADTLEDSVVLIHQFLYGTENYQPTPELVSVANQIRAEVARQIGY